MTLSEHLSVFSALYYGNALEKLTDERLREFAIWCKEGRIEPFLLWKMPDVCQELPDYAQWKKRLSQLSIGHLQDEVKLKKLYGGLKAAGIRFAPIKGVDLAYRVYPHSSLRSYSDWDILIHYKDWEAAGEFFRNDGWNVTAWEMTEKDHHGTILRKNGVCLEPHWTFPRFNGVTPEELWEYIQPVSAGSCHHALSPELNILMLARHFGSRNYLYSPIGRFLLDVGFLLQTEQIDWNHLKDICKNWHLPYSGDLLEAFPEFFPEKQRSLWDGNSEQAKKYRLILEERQKFQQCTPVEIAMTRPANGTGRARFFDWLQGLSFSHLRRKYSLPEETGVGKMLRVQWNDLAKKAASFLRQIGHGRNNDLKAYLRLVSRTERVEK